MKHHKSSLALAAVAALAGVASAWAQPADRALPTVTVTSASGFEQNITDAPATISIVTQEELRKKAYTDVLDAVRNVPGVVVTGGGAAQEISIRGMEGMYTLYLIDGVPISSARNVTPSEKHNLGKSEVNLPPIDMVERIEVIRGPMSSLYGSEAMGGVINIITKKHAKTWGGSVSGQYTHQDNERGADGYTSSLYLSGPIVAERLSLGLSAMRSGTDESTYQSGMFREGTSSQPKEDKRKLGARLAWKLDEANDLTLNVDHSEQRYTATRGVSVPSTSTRGAGNIGLNKDVYTLSHAGRYGALRTNTYYQVDDSRRDDPASTNRNQEQVQTLNTQASYFAGKHVITFGGQYKVEELTLTEMQAFQQPGVERWQAALYAEDEWALSEKLSLTFGARWNQDELFSSKITPRVYSVYKLAPNWTLKGGVTTGYKQPSLFQATEGYATTNGGGLVLYYGNRDLKPEESTNYEASLYYDNAAAGLSSSMTVFRTDFKNKIDYKQLCLSSQTAPSCTVNGVAYWKERQYTNLADALLQGVELTTDWRATKTVKLSASYVYTHSEQQSGPNEGAPLNETPKSVVKLGLDWDAAPGLTAWTQFLYRSRSAEYGWVSTGSEINNSINKSTAGYGMVDLGLSYAMASGLRVSAGIYNVTDKKVDTVTNNGVLDGRRYVVALNYRF